MIEDPARIVDLARIVNLAHEWQPLLGAFVGVFAAVLAAFAGAHLSVRRTRRKDQEYALAHLESSLRQLKVESGLMREILERKPETPAESWGLVLQLARTAPILDGQFIQARSHVFGMNAPLDLFLDIIRMQLTRIRGTLDYLAVASDNLGKPNVHVLAGSEQLGESLDGIRWLLEDLDKHAAEALRIVSKRNNRLHLRSWRRKSKEMDRASGE